MRFRINQRVVSKQFGYGTITHTLGDDETTLGSVDPFADSVCTIVVQFDQEPRGSGRKLRFRPNGEWLGTKPGVVVRTARSCRIFDVGDPARPIVPKRS